MKCVLISGGATGIGRACALEFAKAGYYTIVNYFKSEKEAESLVNEVKAFGGNILKIKCDISDEKQVSDMFSVIEKEGLSVDVLINNSGVSSVRMLCDTEIEEYNKVFDTNMKGTYLLTKAASRNMVSKKWGRIINISSVWGVAGASCESVYSASKAAVIGFTKAVSKELAPSGISTNAIAPGVIDTKMQSALQQAR